MRRFFLAAVLVLMASGAQATLIFTIDNYTADELSFTITGTFDADSTGSQPGWLGIKNDWSNNQGVHTELFVADPALTLNTILIGGVAPNAFVDNDIGAWDDGMYWENPSGASGAIAAGTTVSGSVTLSGVGFFDPSDFATLELVSGWTCSQGVPHGCPGTQLPVADYTRLEAGASVVPEPSTALLLGLGLTGLAAKGRRRS